MKIGIDLGHPLYGTGSGAIGIVKETDINREVGYAVINKLRALGHQIVDCTFDKPTSSEIRDLQRRVSAANSNNVDFYLSIHANDYKDSSANGTEVFVYKFGGKAEQYAQRVQSELVSLGFANRKVKERGLYVIKHTVAPAILVELFFIKNQNDVDRYNKYKNEVVDAIVKGVTGKTTSNSNPPSQNTPNKPQSNDIANGVYYVDSLPYNTNAKVQGDFFYVRDRNGNKVSGRRIDDGDRILVLEVWSSSNLAEVIYPASGRWIHGYVRNASNIIKYDNNNKWLNGSTSERVYSDPSLSNYIFTIPARYKATPLYRKGGHLHVAYSRNKANDCSGYVKYNGSQSTRF